MPTQHVNGIDLFFDDVGTGDPVLLLTGLGGVGRGWGEQIERFGSSFRTIVPDHRGTGQSGKPESGYTVENLAVDMAGLVRALDCGPVHVVGSSTGGAIAQVMALDHSDTVRSITLANSWPGADDYFRHQFTARKRVLEAAGTEAYTQNSALFLFSIEYLRNHHEDVQRWCDVASAGGTPPEIMAKRIDMIIGFNQRDRLGSIDVPTLVLVGDADICTPPYFSEDLAELIPGARLEVLAGGHLIYKEAPELFHNTVLNFINSLH